MRDIQVPTREEVSLESQQIFDQIEKQLGMVPNLYATIGHSSNALGAFLAYGATLSKNSLSKKEREAIKLVVSEENNCDYCRAAHTMLGRLAGFTEEETIEIRKGQFGADLKLQALIQVALEIAKDQGKVNTETKQRFFNQGYDEQALIDTLATVIDVSFTNFAHRLTDVAIDFPPARRLEEALV